MIFPALRDAFRELRLGMGSDLIQLDLRAELKGEITNDGGTSTRPSLSIIEALGGRATAAGIRVTEDNALTCGAVYRCVRILAESIAARSLPVYQRLADDAKARARSHPNYRLLHDAPNRWQTSFEWREMQMGHCGLRGNAYSFLDRDGRGRVREIVPQHPGRVRLKVDSDGDVWYEVTPLSQAPVYVPREDVLHLRGLSSDGYLGLSPVGLMRETIALGQATQEHGARLFSNGARPGGIIEIPYALTSPQAEAFRKAWEDMHAGSSRAHRVAVLEQGMKWTQVGLSSEDAQFLETRRFQNTEIYGWFGIPPHMVGDTERSTSWGTGIEQQQIGFVAFTLLAWVKRWEQAIQESLFVPGEREEYFAEFNLADLVRGDLRSRYAAYAVGRQWGWLSVNDIRRLENMNPIGPEGDVYLQPLNMIPAGSNAIEDADRQDRQDADRRILDEVRLILSEANGRH